MGNDDFNAHTKNCFVSTPIFKEADFNRCYDPDMSTFITTMASEGAGPRLAVKDIIDVAGVPTTAGSRALERIAQPALHDAPCLTGARAAGARFVGKTNLHELAMLPIGTNPWFGTPTNPLDSALIPGGSSSGSAVAVANGDADVALGSDTGGSIRVPAACCGIAGLKTTHGRISIEGVWPLAPSLDTIGPMATTVAGLRLGMELLEPGFTISSKPARRVGRVTTSGRPEIEAAIDRVLHDAGFEVVPVTFDLGIGAALFAAIYFAEIWESNHQLIESDRSGIGDDVAQMFDTASIFRAPLDNTMVQLESYRATFRSLFADVELLAMPTMPIFAPRIDELTGDLTNLIIEITSHLGAFNALGAPCTAQPVDIRGSRNMASLQLVGPHGGEELLLATAALVEDTVAHNTLSN